MATPVHVFLTNQTWNLVEGPGIPTLNQALLLNWPFATGSRMYARTQPKAYALINIQPRPNSYFPLHGPNFIHTLRIPNSPTSDNPVIGLS